jgi:hypothetical protein
VEINPRALEDLRVVNVHGDKLRYAEGEEQSGHREDADGFAGQAASVLSGVCEVRRNHYDAFGPSLPDGVEGEEELDHARVLGRGGGVDHDDVAVSHLRSKPDIALAVREEPVLNGRGFDAQKVGDLSTRLLGARTGNQKHPNTFPFFTSSKVDIGLFLGRVRCEECTMFYCERAVEFDMKSLIVYFSRTGNTRKVAEAIHGLLGGDLVEIREAGGRGGPIGWLRSGMESIRKMLPRLQPIEKEPSSYDLVVVGTPIWASNMSSPVRAFITRYREEFPRTAFFCTGDGDDPALVFGPMLELLGREPVATVGIIGEERGDDLGMEKIATFVEALKEAL